MTKLVSSDHKGATILVAQLAACGLKHAVISPGSRNAPLTIAFDSHPDICTHVVIDERAASHFAIGLSLESGIPAAVVCTSGTASLNHGPAIAEAFHHRIPLISITADRPTSVIEKGHGQSVFQTGVFSKNCKHSIIIDELELSDEAIIVETKKAFDIAASGTSVHINVPFEEPLYGKSELGELHLIDGSKKIKCDLDIPEELIAPDSKILVLGGSLPFYRDCSGVVLTVPGICEKFSGISGDAVVHSGDMFLAKNDGCWPEDLIPDYVITVGTPTLSKSLRNKLIELKPQHYHVSSSGKGWDTWGGLVKTIECDPKAWLIEFEKRNENHSGYREAWSKVEKHANLDGVNWSDALAFSSILNNLPLDTKVHLSNSTSARYIQLIESPLSLRIHCNRGVAGIDGCTSTAVGDATESDGLVFLISGDIAFLYDINGLASVEEIPSNFKAVVINNGGGEIFRWLNGPEEVGLVDKYFETRPRTKVKSAAEYCGLDYFCASDLDGAKEAMSQLISSYLPAVLEIITDPITSTEVYKTILRR